jgi:hypothetical protein
MKPSLCHLFRQGCVYIAIALARKGRMEFNPIAPLKRQNICLKINAIIIIALMTGFGVRTVSKQVFETTSKIALLNKR